MATQSHYTESPRTDIFESAHEYLLLLDLPGVALANLSIQLHEQQLTIDGTRDENFHFRRSFAVPSLIKEESIGAQLQNGVLEIRIPKADAAKPRAIAVTSAN